MPDLSSDIVQHRLPLNLECSPLKQKLRRMKLETSLKIKEEVKKQFDKCNKEKLLEFGDVRA